MNDMTAEQQQRIKGIFETALDQPPEDRDSLVGRLCGDDPIVRAEVEALLRAHTEADGFLVGSPLADLAIDDFTPAAQAFDFTGRRIGVYELRREIGQGGMATVYLAERMDGEYRQQVALKLVLPGADAAEVTRRFKQERQILASLDHPNIARLIDGGTTAEGWPYLVMEYIAGAPITQFCRQNGLALHERLRLFQTVCAAVAYAHRNLVIHRDIKPSNILVAEANGATLPKLLDFGIAKLLAPDFTGQSQPTVTGLRPMTPEYASPEQLREETITTASDVYSLGVLLYELLTDAHPHDLKDRPLHEIIRVVCDEDPPAPSLRRPELRGDLDNIAMMALRKDPPRRYQTVEQFSEDVGRYLAGEVVSARPATLHYRAAKYVKRHKALTASLGAVAILLIVGLLTALWQLVAARERERGQRRQLYAADMRQAGQDWSERNMARARKLVERYRPGLAGAANAGFPAGEDLRGFEWFYLWNALHPAGQTLQHHGEAYEFAVTGDQGRLYVGTQNGAIELWNLSTRQFERVFARLDGRPRAVALARSGLRLAAGGENKSLFVWDLATGNQVFRNPGLSVEAFYAAALSEDGNLLAAGGADGVVYVWEVGTARLLHTLRHSERRVQALAFSPGGAYLAVAGAGNQTVKIWDAQSFGFVKALEGSQNTFFDLKYTPDGKHLAAANRDDQVLIWSVADGKLARTITGNQSDSVWTIDFSSDGKTLATAGGGHIIRLWDWATGRKLAEQCVDYEISTIGFLPNSADQILLAAEGSETKIFNFGLIRPPVVVVPAASEVSSVAISPDGQTLVYGESAGRFTVKSLGTPGVAGPRSVSVMPDSVDGTLECVAFSPDGRLLAIAYGLTPTNGTVELRDPATGQTRLAPGELGHYVNKLAFAPDGKTLATANHDGTVTVRDGATLRPIRTIRTERGGVQRVVYSPDGKRLISLQASNLAKGRDPKTGAQLFEFHCLTIGGFSPDGKYFTSADEKYNITLRDGLTGAAVRTLEGHSNFLAAMAFSPDGRRLASAGDDLTIRLWEVETGMELLALKGHTKRITSLAFRPDGRTLVSGSKDKTLRIWQTATAEEVRTRD